MTKFKVGDKFIPRKPENTRCVPYWEEGKDEFNGRVMIIEDIFTVSGYILSEGALFHPDWCEKVEEPIVETSKAIDWEQRRYEIAKDFMAAQINSLYSSLKSKGKEWSYIDESRYAVNAADILIKQLQK